MVTGPAALLLAAAMAMAPSAQASGGCTPATEFTPRLCPAGLPRVSSVRVTQQGRPSAGPAEPLVDCRQFRLTATTVRRYLARAQQVEDDRGEHAVDRGPCEAEGTLRFADGSVARWRIEQVGTATLWRGAEGAQPTTLFCTRCRFSPFVPSAGR